MLFVLEIDMFSVFPFFPFLLSSIPFWICFSCILNWSDNSMLSATEHFNMPFLPPTHSGNDCQLRLYDEEDSAHPALLERDFHSFHRNVPGLRRAGVDANTIRQVRVSICLLLYYTPIWKGIWFRVLRWLNGRRTNQRSFAYSIYKWSEISGTKPTFFR